MSPRLQPGAGQAASFGNSIAAAATNAAPIVRARRRSVAMGQPCQLQGLRYRPVPAKTIHRNLNFAQCGDRTLTWPRAIPACTTGRPSCESRRHNSEAALLPENAVALQVDDLPRFAQREVR